MALLSYRRHRFPPSIIQHAIWLYLRFTLSYRDVEDLLVECGLDISIATETTGESKIRDLEFFMAFPPNPGLSAALGWDGDNPTATLGECAVGRNSASM